MAKRYSHTERQQHLDTWQQSGLTKQYYCQQHDLNPATFYYWQYEFTGRLRSICKYWISEC
ncbi:TPA: hypothetical protein PXM11_003292 [Yersinia enterocolitica]|uniref:Transposase n=1 Tax=Yersinia enterocolitica TaxID=630 RepID=A0ABP1XXQ4_YEREN|nr:transposase [Yersinia enterocolitica]CFV28411.1 Uncharacterised protein [Yersinia enterocolitica]CND08174.1 Uncharacterised protein [Yersinia enterocolitica]CNE77968.1 Uncharacterised protein [Yersinia enterocolitica]CNG09335.1 Uncharacterised protein [Yersinia enterocolitica]CQD67077.1 Uncharacterised protein [Yersinia enterocolitica]